MNDNTFPKNGPIDVTVADPAENEMRWAVVKRFLDCCDAHSPEDYPDVKVALVLMRNSFRDEYRDLATYVDGLRADDPLRVKLSRIESEFVFDWGLTEVADAEERVEVGSPLTPLQRLSLAAESNDPEVLNNLADDGYFETRCFVANNPHTPKDALRRLAESDYADIRAKVARNPETPSDILALLSEDKSDSVRQEVARHSNTPAEALSHLAGDEDLFVRMAAASNPNTPADVLSHLAGDENLFVRMAAEGNPFPLFA